ncbi:MAG: hypothetical protein J1G02_05935 [Clostridiales bacterium]|nr:hypothetical protein [Clostridiales bacterium]
MIVAFVEPDEYEQKAWIVEKLQDVITQLVIKEGAIVFMFTNAGNFDGDCYTIVSRLKKYYPYIERLYFHGGCDYDVGYVNWMSEFYDNLHFPEKGVVISSHMRDCAMIDMCTVVVTCGSAPSVEYARQKKKRVINIYKK